MHFCNNTNGKVAAGQWDSKLIRVKEFKKDSFNKKR